MMTRGTTAIIHILFCYIDMRNLTLYYSVEMIIQTKYLHCLWMLKPFNDNVYKVLFI